MYFYDQRIIQEYYYTEDKFETKRWYSFTSEEDYLGIISLDPSGFVIDTTSKSIIIRIKRAGDKNWIHSNTYNAFDLVNSVDFHFGFPVQEKSKNMRYLVEIELTNSHNRKYPIFDIELKSVVLRHYYPKTFFVRHPIQAMNFIGGKVMQSLNEKTLLSILEVLFFPLFVYGIALVSIHSKKSWKYFVFTQHVKYRKYFERKDVFIMIPIGIDILIQSNSYYFILVGLMIAISYKIKAQSMYYYFLLLSFCLFLTSVLFTLVNVRFIADRVSLWVFMLVVLSFSRLMRSQFR